jgi:hypothetical protein
MVAALRVIADAWGDFYGFLAGWSFALVVKMRVTFEETRGSRSSGEGRKQSAYSQSHEVINVADERTHRT